MERWQEKGQFLQAWGPKDSPEHYRFIIDCMLNIPLLYWASEVTVIITMRMPQQNTSQQVVNM